MHRFFLPDDAFQDENVLFPKEIAHQILKVLRLQPGDEVLVLNHHGSAYVVSLLPLESHELQGRTLSREAVDTEPRLSLSLYIGLTQREKFEWILQKGCELGVSQFVPFISERSLVQKNTVVEKKLQRWESILREAAEQSHRAKIPVLQAAMPFSQALQEAVSNHDLALIPWEEEHAQSLRQVLQRADGLQRIALMIGPEGGFSPQEVQRATAAGIQAVTLGARILRMETAAVAAAAMVMYQMGEME